ncbi:MAG TPA: purine-nucleoside phosphorylase [Acidimicrobiales bacterium]|nr:purine-nucleoside phosphorylase [Acidimicrobiales bacterium]
MTTSDPFEAARDAATVLAERLPGAHEVAVILGSGWGPAADRLGPTDAEIPMAAIPGFPEPSVAGHRGAIRSVTVGGGRVLVLVGRAHLYEGHGVDVVVHGVRAAVLAGCRVVVLTNAAGGVDPTLEVGTPVLLADHLNLSGHNPLVGVVPPEDLGPRFVDLSDVYSARLRALAREVQPLREGVYAMFLGPSYETKAEVRMARTLGADLVGMSTALEAIAARQLGAEVLGLSLVTNPAAGVVAQPIDHHEVLAAGRDAAAPLGDLLHGIVARILSGS